MKEIQVIPLESAIGVGLGWTREEIHKQIEKPDRIWEQSDHYQKEQPLFSLDYNLDNRVEYISISNPKEEGIKILFRGIDVFGTPATDLIEQIKKNTDLRYDRNDPELQYSFIFPDVELSFWRPVIQENQDDEHGKYFEAIGIGIKGYYID